MSRLEGQDGFTLVEVLATTLLLIVVLGATLSAFESFGRVDRRTQAQNDANQETRRMVDLLTRELRNLASPSTINPQAVEKAEQYELIYETVHPVPTGNATDRNLKRVRYCLAPSSGGSAAIWKQEQIWEDSAVPPATPTSTTCPSSTWPTQTNVTRDVVNREKGEPIFMYNDTVLDRITSVQVELFSDVDTNRRPEATRLASGVFLRNQNRAPVASFTATDTGTAHRLLLNGSASEDPEGNGLVSYKWYADGNLDEGDEIASGVVAYWTPPGSTFPQTHSITLRVEDSGAREDDATQTATVN
jgi:type II secretory pathway pseudopilin PulG